MMRFHSCSLQRDDLWQIKGASQILELRTGGAGQTQELCRRCAGGVPEVRRRCAGDVPEVCQSLRWISFPFCAFMESSTCFTSTVYLRTCDVLSGPPTLLAEIVPVCPGFGECNELYVSARTTWLTHGTADTGSIIRSDSLPDPISVLH